MEKWRITKAQESEDVEVEDEVNVHRFGISGIVHMEFLPQGTTVNHHVYKEILRRLIVSVRTKRRDRYENNDWLLHHDNAPSHNALSIRQFLTEWNGTMLDQPPYSPDLAPCKFFYFQNWKASLKETHFPDLEAMKGREDGNSEIPEEAFCGCIEG